ncbi:MFS transporter [Clostridium sp. AF19-22AC]|jgi:Na+/melibiose symporter-like transporter|uniref:MFS transporter n=1 Tax=Clostridia TaxID=186801 RepID=UPI000E5314D3|nr:MULTISPECIES: MFS transporter [Clostridia]RHR33038.1 MFS transporter [Clostridium sp. AF19-22AC]
MKTKNKKENPGKIGALKFWAWSARDLSLSTNFIVLSFITIYCTNTLDLNPALVGALLMASKIVDAITDLFAGYVIDRTETKLGKARPYEFAILGVWICTWLLYSAPAQAGTVVKCIWIFVMYIFVNSIFTTLLNANGNAYMVRAFGTNEQRVKLASFGGIIIMVASILINMIFPVAMSRIAVSPSGWSKMVAMFAVPLGVIGIMRFLFVKETEKVDTVSEKVRFKDVLIVLKENKYVYMVALLQLVYSIVTGTGVATYYYTYIVKNLEIMGFVSAASVFVVPLMIFFPLMLKKITMGKMVQAGCIIYAAGSFMIFISKGNITALIAATIIIGIGSLPITYLINLMALDCGSYNAYMGRQRMDGTIGAVKGFANKLGGALGSGLLGVMLSLGGFNAKLEDQGAGANMAISSVYGLIPCILFAAMAVMLVFYKLDKMMPEINRALEQKKEDITKAAEEI